MEERDTVTIRGHFALNARLVRVVVYKSIFITSDYCLNLLEVFSGNKLNLLLQMKEVKWIKRERKKESERERERER